MRTIFMFLLLIGLVNCQKSSTVNAAQSIKKENLNKNIMDSIIDMKYTIYDTYDFFSFTGKKLDKKSIKYPLLALKNNNNTFDLISIVSADSIVHRTIKKQSELYTEKIINYRYPDQFEQMTVVFVYRPNYIVAFKFAEDIYSEDKKNKYLSHVYFIYPNYIYDYYQGDNDERLIDNIDSIDFSISEKGLNKVFPGSRDIEKKIFYKSRNYNKINNNIIEYLMLNKGN